MFWFRFVESNRSLVELEKFDLLEQVIRSDYPQFSGFVLEKYFRQLYGEKDRVTEVSHWWDSQGENEIDLIAISQLDRCATIAEVKRNAQKIDKQQLMEKFEHIKKHLRGYNVEFIALSLNDM